MTFWRPMFGTRRSDRDLQTDRERAARLDEALDGIIASARRERAGLGARIEALGNQAAFIDQQGDAHERSRLDTFEAQLVAADLRMKALGSQIAGLERLRGEAVAIFPEQYRV
jgi:hypothetical protein